MLRRLLPGLIMLFVCGYVYAVEPIAGWELAPQEVTQLEQLRGEDSADIINYLSQRRQADRQKLEALRREHPDEYVRIIALRKQHLTERLNALHQQHPQRYQSLMEARREREYPVFQEIKLSHPERFKDIVQHRQQSLNHRINPNLKDDKGTIHVQKNILTAPVVESPLSTPSEVPEVSAKTSVAPPDLPIAGPSVGVPITPILKAPSTPPSPMINVSPVTPQLQAPIVPPQLSTPMSPVMEKMEPDPMRRSTMPIDRTFKEN